MSICTETYCANNGSGKAYCEQCGRTEVQWSDLPELDK